MFFWRRYSPILCVLVFLSPFSLGAQDSSVQTTPGDSFSDNVTFDHPEGYVDRQFKELAQEYIQPKVPDDLDLILGKERKLTPEALQRLVDLVAEQVSQKIEKRLSTQPPKNRLRNQPNLPSFGKNTQKTFSSRLKELSTLKETPGEKSPKRLIIREAQPMEYSPFVGQQNPASSTEKTNSIFRISLNGVKNRRVNINNASPKRKMDIVLSHGAKVGYIQVNLLAQNIKTREIFSIAKRNFRVSSIPSLSSLRMDWNLHSQPQGNYKIQVRASFFDLHGNLLRTSTQFWGNASPSEFFIVRN